MAKTKSESCTYCGQPIKIFHVGNHFANVADFPAVAAFDETGGNVFSYLPHACNTGKDDIPDGKDVTLRLTKSGKPRRARGPNKPKVTPTLAESIAADQKQVEA